MAEPSHPLPLPAAVLEARERGDKIEAIKRLREQTGLGLKEAKDAVEGKAPSPVTDDPGGSKALPWLGIAVVLLLIAYFVL